MFLLVTIQGRTSSASYLCPILTQSEYSLQNYNKISQYKISRTPVHWETNCVTRRGKLTADMTKLTAAFCATQRMHLTYVMVVSSCVLLQTKIFFSVTFDRSSKCPTMLFFPQFFRDRSNKAHTNAVSLQSIIKLNQCPETFPVVCGLE